MVREDHLSGGTSALCGYQKEEQRRVTSAIEEQSGSLAETKQEEGWGLEEQASGRRGRPGGSGQTEESPPWLLQEGTCWLGPGGQQEEGMSSEAM